jgi:hypothetical protein
LQDEVEGMEKEPEQLSVIYENVQKGILEAESVRVQQRFEHNLVLLEGGGVNVLLSDEFINGLVFHLRQKHQNDWEYARKLLHAIGKAVCTSESRIRERAVTIFSMVTEHYLETRRTEELLIITSYLCDWLSCEKIPFSGFPVIMKKLEQCSVWLLQKGRFHDVYKVLRILSDIIGATMINRRF